MAKKGPRGTIVLKNDKTGHVYYTSKNYRNTPDKLILRKYDPETREHLEFVEGKMK